MTLISTSKDLQHFLEELPTHSKYVALDTEFMRDKTYVPQVCLIQLAIGTSAVAIDPLAPNLNLEPLWNFLKRPDLLKVFHAARQDLEGLLHLSGTLLTPFFDTQLAVMAYGMRDSISYEDLVSTLLHHTLDKSQRVVNWAERPLSEDKITYALNDVIYLLQLYPLIAQQLKEWGRENWIAEDMKHLSSADTYRPNIVKAWTKVKGWALIKNLSPSGFLFLQKIAAWREIEASRQNKARRLVLRDERICFYVTLFQKNPSAFQEHFCERGIKNVLFSYAVEVQKTSVADLPTLPERPHFSSQERDLYKKLSQLLKDTSIKAAVASRLIGTREDVERLVRKWSHSPDASQFSEELLFKGWRGELFGKEARKIFEKICE